MEKVLITGANGFIGTNLIKEISEQDVQIIAVVRDDNSDVTGIENKDNVKIVKCPLQNIVKLPELVQDRDIDLCIHLAWAGNSGDGRGDYELQLNNEKYSLDLIKTLTVMNVSRFVGAGTLAEKDVLNYHPNDGATPNIVSLYGVAKLSSHFMTKAMCSNNKIEHIWCYLPNTYGIGNTTNNFINFATKTMLTGKRAAFTAGEQMYDFVYITDTVRALWAAATKGNTNVSYYLGSTKPRQLKEYIKEIRDAINPEIELHLGEIPFNGQALAAEEFDCSKLVRDTGYVPKIDFSDGIVRTINWLKEVM